MNEAIESGGSAPPIQAEPIKAIVDAHAASLVLSQEQEDAVAAAMFALPRRMKQPIKDELRRQLEVANAQAAYWKGLLDDAVPIATVRKLLVVAVVIGFALGRFIP